MEKELTESKKPSIGVCGTGFVGATCYQAFHQLEGWEAKAFDKNPEDSLLAKSMGKVVNFVSLEELAKCDVVFVCVPTPMKLSTGESDTSIVEHCVATLRNYNKTNSIVIKSTVPPGTTKKLNFNHGNVFFNPEFLTEANAYSDFISLEYQIIGINEDNKDTVNHEHPLLRLYRDSYVQKITSAEQLFVMDSTSAEMVKYIRNCYLATRLSFFNEIYQVCEKLDLNYEKVVHYAGIDKRVGQHYNKVDPELKGWGLSCFPKDLNALKHLAEQLGIKPLVLQSVWDKNLEVRQVRDWEQMSKAVS
jgi:UDPglucose 6-dehydrogenase